MLRAWNDENQGLVVVAPVEGKLSGDNSIITASILSEIGVIRYFAHYYVFLGIAIMHMCIYC